MEVLTPIEDLIAEGQAALDRGDRARARECFAAAADVTPEPDLLQVLASLAFEDGLLEEATRHLQRILEINPENLDALESLATLYFTVDQPKRALAYQEQALALKPDHVPGLVNASIFYFELKEPIHALRYAERALAIEPENIDALLMVGQVHFEAKRYEEASRPLASAVALKPDTVDALVALGWCRFHLGQYAEAKIAFDMAVDRAPGAAEAWSGLAKLAQRDNESESTIAALRRVVELQPNDTAAQLDLAWALLESGDSDAAVGVAEKTFETFGKDPLVVRRLGGIYLRLKRYDKAEILLRLAASLEPDNDELQEQLAVTYLLQKDYELAIGRFKRLREMRPLNVRATLSLALTYTLWFLEALFQGNVRLTLGGLRIGGGRTKGGRWLEMGNDNFNLRRFEKAVMYYQKIEADDPVFPVACAWLANCHVKLGDSEAAMTACEQGLAVDPSCAPLLAMAGTLALMQNKPQAAQRILEDALERDPEQGDAWVNLGRAYHQNGAYDEAFEAYQRALELNVQDAYLYRLLGDVALAKGDRSQSAIAYRMAMNGNPLDLVSVQRLIECCYGDRRFEEGIKLAKHALSIDPRCHSAYAWLGRLYRELNRNTAAVDAYNKAIELQPDNPFLYRNLAEVHEALRAWQTALEFYQQAYALEPRDKYAKRGVDRMERKIAYR